jgi:methylglutaconyl-CoA hydratase
MDLKKCFWEGTEDWDEKLMERAEMSGRLVISEFTKKYMKEFLEKRKNEKT